jgi:hypothetical protein
MVDGKVRHVAGNERISQMVLDRAYLVTCFGDPVNVDDDPEFWLEGLKETYGHDHVFGQAPRMTAKF